MKMLHIPKIGMGTFGSDHISANVMASSVKEALAIGYRMIDCARVYDNEREIGEVLAASKIKRSDLWLTGKVWNDMHGKANVIRSAELSMKDLQTDYLDLFLVHWPFPNHHPPFAHVDERNPNAVPYIHKQFMDTWSGMEELQRKGMVRHIGVSNMTEAKLRLLLGDCSIRPFAAELELHPTFAQKELRAYMKAEGIIPIGYSPLGSPNRPARDRTDEDVVDMEHPIVVELARKHGVHPASICLKWASGNGIIPIPLSTKVKNLRSNFESVHSDPLTEEELTMLEAVDSNNRLIKGQVFLWEGATSWRDLWDEDGTITGGQS